MAFNPLLAPDIGLDAAKPVEGLNPLADPNAPPPPGAFKKGLAVGTAGLKSSGYGLGALAARVIGSPELEAKALAGVAEQNAVAAQNDMPYDQVKLTDPAAVGKYFAYLLGQAAPTMLTMLAGGGVGAGLGALAGRGTAAALAARAAGTMAPATKAGAFIGAVAPDVGMETGSIFPEALKTGVENPVARSLAGGVAAASLDFLPLFAGEAYYKMLRATRARGGWGAMAKETSIAAPIFGVAEAAQEAGQSVIERAAAGQPLTGDEANKDYLGSALGGGAPGLFLGALGGAFGARGKARVSVTAPPKEQLPETRGFTDVTPSGTGSPVQKLPEMPSTTGQISPTVNLSPEEQHAAATQTMEATLAQIEAVKTAHEAAGARMAELEIEAKLPSVADRRPAPVIAKERAEAIKLRRATKGKVDALELQFAAARAAAAALEPVLAARTPVPVAPETGTITPEVGVAPVTPSSETPAVPVDHARNELMGNVAEFDSQVRENATDNADTVLAGAKQWAATNGVPESTFRQELNKRWRDDPSPRMQELGRAILGEPTTPAQAVQATTVHLAEQGLAPKSEAPVVAPVQSPIASQKGTTIRDKMAPPMVDNKPVKVVNPNAVGSVRDQMAAREPALRELVATKTGGSTRYKNAVADATVKRITLIAQNARALAPEAQLAYIQKEFSTPIGAPTGKSLANRFPKNEVDQVIADVHAAVQGAATRFSKGAVEGALPKLVRDNPGGQWLQHNREDNDAKGKGKFGEPRRFGPVTAAFHENVLVPVEVLAKLPGLMGEQRRIRTDDLVKLQAHMKERGRLPEGVNEGKDYAPYIEVNQDGEAWVSEGNHRIMAAKALGWKYLPTQIRYFTGGEQADSVLSPANLQKYADQATSDNRTLDEYKSSAALTSDQFWALPQDAKEAAVDAFNRAMAIKGNELISKIRTMVGDWPGLTVRTFTAVPGEPIGGYTRTGPLKAVISMAVNAKNELSIADHEGYHAAEDLVLNSAERQIIANAFKPGRPLFEKLMASVRQYDLENKTKLADEVAAIPAEARAYGFEFWRRGELQAEGALQRVLEKIKQFFERVANAVRGLGFQSLEDVFVALDRGQYAERQKNEFSGIAGLDSRGAPETWYRSALTDQVTALPTKAASSQGWKDQIKGLVAKGLVKQAEIDAVGLNEFLDLQQGKVTKDQVTAFLRENGVRVEETELGEAGATKSADEVWSALTKAGASQEDADRLSNDFEKYILDTSDDYAYGNLNKAFAYHGLNLNKFVSKNAAPKFAIYQLPGGTNYRELVLRLPVKDEQRGTSVRKVGTGYEIMGAGEHANQVAGLIDPITSGGHRGEWRVQWNMMPTKYFHTEAAALNEATMRSEAESVAFRSTHFNQPNILAHIRFNERTDAEGKRVLFIEEVQSDWAQKGKKEGFKNVVGVTKDDLGIREQLGRKEKFFEVYDKRNGAVVSPYHETMEQAQNALDEQVAIGRHTQGTGTIPSAPFISSQKFGVFKENTEMRFDAKAEIAGPDEGKVRRFGTMAEAQAFAKKYSAEARDLGQQPDTSAWVGLSLKRVIRYAAENGFDKVAWTNGSQQVERYKNALQNAVDRIEWTKTKDGVHLVGYKGRGRGEVDGNIKDEARQALRRNDNLGFDTDYEALQAVATHSDWDSRWPDIDTDADIRALRNYREAWINSKREPKKVVDTTEKENALSDSIGKTMADQIRNDPAQSGAIEGENITISDTGMAGFYDKIVPSVANDVLKKLGGGRVQELSVKTREPFMGGKYNIESDNVKYWLADSQTSAQIGPKYNSFIEADDARHAIYISESKGATPQPGFTITEAMATRAAQGLPLFSKAAVDMDREMQAGNLEQIQSNRVVAKLIESANSAPFMDKLKQVGLTPEIIASKGGLSRWWNDWMSRPAFISAFSKGFKNVFETLENYLNFRSITIERMLHQTIPAWYKASFADQDAATNALLERSLNKYLVDSTENRALLEPLSEKARALVRQANTMIAGFLDAEFAIDQQDYRDMLTSPGAYDKWLKDRAEQVKNMKDTGYMPFRRYGDHTVRISKMITDTEGKQQKVTVGLEMFAAPDDAVVAETIYRNEAKRQGLDYTIERGIKQKNVRETAPSIRQFLDTLRRQGVEISQAERERLVIALTDSDAIVRNRLMHREGIPGYSKDGERILNEFGVNMASKLAYSKFASAIDAAAEGRAVTSDVDANGNANIQIDYRKEDQDGKQEPVDEYKARNLWTVDGPMHGYYFNRATKLLDAVLVPNHGGEWSKNLRGAGMMYFIGGSISSALVNIMSIPMLLVPQLSIHTDYTNAMATTLGAWKLTWQHQAILRDITRLKEKDANGNWAHALPGIDNVSGLRDALIAAADKLQDTELHQILGISQGDLFARSRSLRRAMDTWMLPFRISEQTNRITSFIAGYKIGQQDRSLTGQELFKFARDMVDSTQNNYSMANRPGIANSPIGAMLFQFKSFPLFMVEAAVLMYKASPRSAIYMLLGLTMMTGVQGLPFAEAIENLIDTIAQHLFNSPFNTRRAMRNVLKDASEAVVGYDLSEIAMRGMINEILGVSASSRIGAGDFVPGSRLGTADADAGRILEQFLGAPLSMVKDSLSSVGKLAGGVLTGDWKQTAEALRAGGPIAIRNVIKGAEQLDTGFAWDSKGRKIKDVGTMSAILQLSGLSSAAVAKAYEFESINVQTKAFYTQVSQDLEQQTIRAMKENDTQKLQEISDLRNAWNTENPTMPIMFSASALRRAAMLADMPMDRRSVVLWGRRIRGANVFNEMDEGSN